MKRLRQHIRDFFYKDNGYLDLMSRLSGIWLLGILPLELFVVFAFGPYHVPPWRLGDHFLLFPEPANWISIIVWSLYFFACLALIAGKGTRFLAAFLFTVWLYYQSLDRYIFQSSFVLMLAAYLIAFSINSKPKSLSRFVIQVSVSSCYLFSALHKLHPEFLSGLTLQDLLGRGYMLRPEILPAIHWLSLPRWFTDFCTYLVIAGESFIGLGLWFKASRIYAAALGVILHLAFTIAIPGIELFAPIAWTGYLAFFERKNATKAATFKQPAFEKLLALAACTLMLVLPLRFFFLSRYEYINLSLYDRVPWGYSMFLFNEQLKEVQILMQSKKGVWHQLEAEGRAAQTTSDNDMLALIQYLAAKHPEAERIVVRCKLIVNSHAVRLKELRYNALTRKTAVSKINIDGLQLHSNVQ